MFEILEEKLLTSLPIPPTLPGFKCVSILVPPVKPVECILFYMPLVCYIFTTSCNFLCKTVNIFLHSDDPPLVKIITIRYLVSTT